MCWNEAVSLNTFLFSALVLLLVFYNNTFTKYKIPGFNNKWVYAFAFSVIAMQLVEFFIWRNINNKYYNRLFSFIAAGLLVIQPILSIMMVPTTHIRNKLLTAYLIVAVPYSIYNFFTNKIYSTVSKKGHLQWVFFQPVSLEWVGWLIWLFFFSFSLLSVNFNLSWLFSIILLGLSYYNYKNDGTVGSMWCWPINLLAFYYAAYLLIYLPLCEKNSLC